MRSGITSRRREHANGLPICLLALHALAAGEVASAYDRHWTPGTYPNPMVDPDACGRPGVQRSFICDPDNLLTARGANILEVAIIKPGTSTGPVLLAPGVVPEPAIH
jgi:hypothetical protein